MNTWTKTKGNHTIKWGVDLKRIRDNLLQDQTYSPRGIYYFGHEQTALCTPDPVGSNGLATSCNLLEAGDRQRHGQLSCSTCRITRPRCQHIFPGLPAVGIFRVRRRQVAGTPKLTIDLGVRWEFYPPATPAFSGGFSNYDPTTNNLVIAGVGGNPSNLGMKTRYNVFCAARRAGLPADRKDSDPRRFRHQLYAVPGQHLRVQLSGARQQLLHATWATATPRPCFRTASRRRSRRIPAAGAGGDSFQRHHSGHRLAVEQQLRCHQPQLQESIHGKLEPGGAARAAGSLDSGCGLRGHPRRGYGRAVATEHARQRALAAARPASRSTLSMARPPARHCAGRASPPATMRCRSSWTGASAICSCSRLSPGARA